MCVSSFFLSLSTHTLTQQPAASRTHNPFPKCFTRVEEETNFSNRELFFPCLRDCGKAMRKPATLLLTSLPTVIPRSFLTFFNAIVLNAREAIAANVKPRRRLEWVAWAQGRWKFTSVNTGILSSPSAYFKQTHNGLQFTKAECYAA